jgi:hypothetical protein
MKAQQKSNKSSRRNNSKSKKTNKNQKKLNQNNLNIGNNNGNNNVKRVKNMRYGYRKSQKKTHKMRMNIAQRKKLACKSVKKNQNRRNNGNANCVKKNKMRSKGSRKEHILKRNKGNKKSKAKKNQQKRRQSGGFMGSPLIAYAAELPGDCKVDTASGSNRQVYVPNFDSNADEGNIKKCGDPLDTLKDAEFGLTSDRRVSADAIDENKDGIEDRMTAEEATQAMRVRSGEAATVQVENAEKRAFIAKRTEDNTHNRLMDEYISGNIGENDLNELIKLHGDDPQGGVERQRNTDLITLYNNMNNEHKAEFGMSPTKHVLRDTPAVTRT